MKFWPEADKTALLNAFRRAWINLYVVRDPADIGAEEFAMPMACTDCASRLVSTPNNPPFTRVTEEISKAAYISYVAHSLAMEIGTELTWSIADATAEELHFYFNSRSMMHRITGSSSQFFFGDAGSPGTVRGMYIGRGTPATPIYTYWWMVNNNILQSTEEATVHALLDWFRFNGVHFYGTSSLTNMNDHWGVPTQPPANYVMTGTIYTGESTAKNWTAGCHGTTGFIKSVLKAVNIPAEVLYVLRPCPALSSDTRSLPFAWR